MFELYLALSEDKTEASVQLPSMGGPQKMSAEELSELIRLLAELSATMSVAYAAVSTPTVQTVGIADAEPPPGS